MIYTFPRIPLNTSQPGSIKQCFSKFKLDGDVLDKVDAIEHHKKNYYTFFNQLIMDKNFIPTLEEIKKEQAYLHSTIDLLEVGVKTSYNISQSYTPFLHKSHKLSLGSDNVSSLFAEYILARYAYALGSVKFLQKKMNHHMANVIKDSNFDEGTSKEIIEVFKLGFVRLAKLYKNKGLIWQQLNKEYNEKPELRLSTLDIIYKVNEINLANLYIFDNILGKDLKEMQSKVRMFLLCICKVTLNKINSLMLIAKNFKEYTEIEQLQDFLIAYRYFYQFVIFSLLIRENKYCEDMSNVGERMDRSLSQIYYENHLIIAKLLKEEKELDAYSKKSKDHVFIPLIADLYKKILRNKELIKWGYQTYEDMKNEIARHLSKTPTLDDIFARISSDDIIENKVNKLIQDE